jgi:hypothetical protein
LTPFQENKEELAGGLTVTSKQPEYFPIGFIKDI